jgi:glycosyltransferase involved in cell wall biosynthesis
VKIVIVGTASPLRGGIAHYNALLYAALSERHQVAMITFRRQYPAMLFPGKTQQEEGTSEEFRVPSRVLVDSVNPFNWASVGRTIRAEQPDLLLFKYWLPFFGPCFGTIARIVKHGTGTKVVYICDNVIPHEKRPGDRAFTRYAFAPADGFIVQSAAVERDLLSLLPNARYALVPHPVYHGFGNAVPQSEARKHLGISTPHVLLFFGYIRRYKGLAVLLDAMARLRHRADIHLVVVGEFYEDEAPYRQQIHALGLEHSVTVRSDYVPNDEVKQYFSAADAVVLPYTSATQSGIAQIAFNFDTPVIATTVGGLTEIIREGETGVLVPPRDPVALAAGIERFFAFPEPTLLRARVRAEKAQYSWEHLVAALERLAAR